MTAAESTCPHKRLGETCERGSGPRADPVRPARSVTRCLDCGKVWPANTAPMPWWTRSASDA